METSDRESIHQLWDRLTELGASRIDEALECLMSELCRLLKAQDAYWLGTTRLYDPDDPTCGWRPRVTRFLTSTAERKALNSEHYRRVESGHVDPSVIANLNNAGQFRVNIKHEMVPASWYQSEFYQTLFKPLNILDVIFVSMPLGDDIESWLAFERIGEGQPLFGETERELLAYAMRPLKWFHRHLALNHGISLGEKPLTASERRVLCGLLTEKTEQQIAQELSLTQSTVHTYSTRICRKYGVRGRAGLTALWLGNIPELDVEAAS